MLHQWSGLFSLQVKFSELTVDMFRMLQALEREPMNLASQMNKPGMQVPSPSLCHLVTLLLLLLRMECYYQQCFEGE